MVKSLSHLSHLQYYRALAALLFLNLVISAQAAILEGTVQSGSKPIGYAYVSLYRAGNGQSTGKSAEAEVLGAVLSDKNGQFKISYTTPLEDDDVLYLIADVADHPDRLPVNSKFRLAAVLGTLPAAKYTVINERSTVAAAYAMAQFIGGTGISGKNPGLKNAAAMSHNLVTLENGELGRVLTSKPNGEETAAMVGFNTLANMLARCIHSFATCRELFNLAPDFQGIPAGNTLQAMINIAHNPANNKDALFDFVKGYALYQPALSLNEVPDAWTIALRFTDSRHKMDGPGNLAFDRYGNAWITNNYIHSSNPADICGDNHMFAFRPDGSEFPGSPFGGVNHDGGLFGAGYGITFDLQNDLWISNFGYKGSDCTLDQNIIDSLESSVSQFGDNGTPLSPSTPAHPPPYGGWRSIDTNIRKPQGIISDSNGAVWIANCGDDTVIKLPGGKVDSAVNFVSGIPGGSHLSKPFDVAIDTAGNTWVTSNGNNKLFAFKADGTLLEIQDFRIRRPLGLATDKSGNIWIANSGVINPPCHIGETDTYRIEGGYAVWDKPIPWASVLLFTRDGSLKSFTEGGIFMPWSLAVDGNNNVWIANFGAAKSRLVGIAHLCGAPPALCPPGKRVGDPISPPTGYTSNGLSRNTGIKIDASGNVWLTNNWLRGRPHFENPGGHEVVVFIGLAAPVKSPLIGPPQKP